MEKQKPAGFLAGCKTCRYKPDSVPAFVAVAHGLRRMVFHPVGMEQLNLRELADSIRELGLLNPVTVDRENNLIAGLHRMEAVRALGWDEVECTVSEQHGRTAGGTCGD